MLGSKNVKCEDVRWMRCLADNSILTIHQFNNFQLTIISYPLNHLPFLIPYPFGVVGLISILLGKVLAGMASKSTINLPISSGCIFQASASESGSCSLK